ncbi:hypothetical protein LWI29_030718 [Acer saccharum]|uniref:Uncharacterized protein n=1 Tax=Acer saccharum TaxID=4024 RepID=A0AA39S7Q8_ACESA|nr:hypothetical protein LWI29_030718 [Acer saccharum]
MSCDESTHWHASGVGTFCQISSQLTWLRINHVMTRRLSFGVNGSYYKKIADFVDSSGYFLLIVFDVDQLMNKLWTSVPKLAFEGILCGTHLFGIFVAVN